MSKGQVLRGDFGSFFLVNAVGRTQGVHVLRFIKYRVAINVGTQYIYCVHRLARFVCGEFWPQRGSRDEVVDMFGWRRAPPHAPYANKIRNPQAPVGNTGIALQRPKGLLKPNQAAGLERNGRVRFF